MSSESINWEVRRELDRLEKRIAALESPPTPAEPKEPVSKCCGAPLVWVLTPVGGVWECKKCHDLHDPPKYPPTDDFWEIAEEAASTIMVKYFGKSDAYEARGFTVDMIRGVVMSALQKASGTRVDEIVERCAKEAESCSCSFTPEEIAGAIRELKRVKKRP